MKALTTIKQTAIGIYSLYNSKSELIATAKKVGEKFEIYIYGGIAHGKVAYANDWQDLNDKSVEIANLPTQEKLF